MAETDVKITDLLKPELITGVVAIISAIMGIAKSADFPTALLFGMVAVLSYRLFKCEKKHENAEGENRRLTIAVTVLHGLAMQYGGRRSVDLPGLEDLLSGKDQVAFRYNPDWQAEKDRRHYNKGSVVIDMPPETGPEKKHP